MKGFTLIELLVVVLIIGVLAAVAVPQYQRAVAKTRLSVFVAQAYAIRDAFRMYKLANGGAASHAFDLDIWDSTQEGSQTVYPKVTLGNRTFASVSQGVQTGIALAGFRSFSCLIYWSGEYGYCYTYTPEGEALVKSMGWELVPGYGDSRPYYIGKKRDWK